MKRDRNILSLALDLHRSGRIDKAERSYRKLLRKMPGHPDALHGLGLIEYKRGNLPEAARLVGKAITIHPDFPLYYSNYGIILTASHRLKEAIDVLAGAVKRFFPVHAYRSEIREIQDQLVELYLEYANYLLCKGDLSGASDNACLAFDIRPSDPKLHSIWAESLLSCGFYHLGWSEYEWRLRGKNYLKIQVDLPYWDGASLSGRSVIVVSEQGVGDHIMFMSCMSDLLRELGPGACFVECDPRMISLYRRSFPSVCFVTDVPGDVDIQVPVGSLPRFFRDKNSDFPCIRQYLVPDPGCVGKWLERFRSLGKRMVVGISWRGGGTDEMRQIRSIAISDWRIILEYPNAAFVNLQYGEYQDELEAFNGSDGAHVYNWSDSDPLVDLDDFAAKIAALDLVISVDNSAVHMAGALGVPVWVLLPSTPDWRWTRTRATTPWYPSMTLFRQQKPGEWSDVLKCVRVKLESGVLQVL